MSSFAGRMKEYPTISLDRFDKENLHARAYFLSHCHKDHMKGLKGPLLKRKLKFSLTVKLYCSFVTKELLLNNPKYGFWEDHIVALELESPTSISLIDEKTGESEDVVVTLLPAGHCPGSVMFLFEGTQGTVLYTGDFRLATGDVSRMEFLHSGNRVKDIQSVYLDSTFFDPRFYQIPSREACLNGIKELVQDWIILSPYHVVWLNCKAAYGYEYLFTNLSEEFSCQIHVNSLEMFQKMPEILSHVTTDRATQIHACRHPRDEEYFRANRLPCGCTAKDGTPLRIISIKPSTMWFGERTRKTSVVVRMGQSSYRACFSFHSSYSEIKDFLSYICPVNIYPNVVPMGRTFEEVTELLKPLCREHTGRSEIVYKPLGLLKRTRDEGTSRVSDSDDELFDEVAIAPQRKKLLMIEKAEHQCCKMPAPTVCLKDFLPEPHPLVPSANYADCTESNDDDDDDNEEEENKAINNGEKVFQTSKRESVESQPSGDATATVPSASSILPQWDAFFKPASLPTDESSEPDNSQNSLARSSERTCSQSPVRFGEEDDDDDDSDSFRLSSSQSTHISDNGAEHFSEMDTILLRPETKSVECQRSKAAAANEEPGGIANEEPGGIANEEPGGIANEEPGGIAQSPLQKKGELLNSQYSQSEVEDAEQKPDSQESSDFELPPTPGSTVPRAEELRELYRKLAAGEELFLRRGSKGTV